MSNGRLTHLFGHLLLGKFTVKSVADIGATDSGKRRVRVCIAPPTQRDPRSVMERLLRKHANVGYWLSGYCDFSAEHGTFFEFVSKE